jgi:hypothetical protein
MQYLISVIHDQAGLATPDEDAAIDVFNERLQAEGHWVFAGGLASPNTATVIDNRGEAALVTDGPYRDREDQRDPEAALVDVAVGRVVVLGHVAGVLSGGVQLMLASLNFRRVEGAVP